MTAREKWIIETILAAWGCEHLCIEANGQESKTKPVNCTESIALEADPHVACYCLR